jgi:hypothetical protein
LFIGASESVVCNHKLSKAIRQIPIRGLGCQLQHVQRDGPVISLGNHLLTPPSTLAMTILRRVGRYSIPLDGDATGTEEVGR